MRTLVFSLLMLGLAVSSLQAQTIATFEDLTLAHPDTFYVNYTASGTDVGFNDGLAHFPCVYDTSFGGFWSYGFSYSNMTDSVTSGFTNQYAAKAGAGYGGSANYVVAYCLNPATFANTMVLPLSGAALHHPVNGFYVTNTTYAYNSMRDGDMFARKFHNWDWFKLTARGFSGGILTADSVTFYLADFLFPDTTMNYIVKDWQWVSLAALGNVDSLQFSLSSTDNSMYGMNTPAYFCIDNFTTDETAGAGALQLAGTTEQQAARVYPVPAADVLHIDLLAAGIREVRITDATGRNMGTWAVSASKLDLNTAGFAAGTYQLELVGTGKTAAVQFVKQ